MLDYREWKDGGGGWDERDGRGSWYRVPGEVEGSRKMNKC